MDELFGEVGFASADHERKQRIEREIGLTALLEGRDVTADIPDEKAASKAGYKSDSDDNGATKIE